MIHDTPINTMVGFVHSLQAHDERDGLKALAKIPTMVACGDRDLLMPVSHSREMAAALSRCESVIVPGAGHLVGLERPEAVDDALVRLVERATFCSFGVGGVSVSHRHRSVSGAHAVAAPLRHRPPRRTG